MLSAHEACLLCIMEGHQEDASQGVESCKCVVLALMDLPLNSERISVATSNIGAADADIADIYILQEPRQNGIHNTLAETGRSHDVCFMFALMHYTSHRAKTAHHLCRAPIWQDQSDTIPECIYFGKEQRLEIIVYRNGQLWLETIRSIK